MMPVPPLHARRAFVLSALAAGLSWQAIDRALAAASPAPALRPVDLEVAAGADWDYVIIGAGAAGSVLANRLSADPTVRVLLLEAGESTFGDDTVADPRAWPTLQGGRFDWRYATTPQAALGGRALPYPRGKGLGGSTAINALGYMRGAPGAYDRWAVACGDAGWGYAGLLPFFRRSEAYAAGSGEFHGADGPLHVFPVGIAPEHNPLSTAFHAAAAAKFGITADWNGARTEGAAWTHLALAGGYRDSAARAYLAPILERPNLAIATGVRVRRLAIGPSRCERVEFTAAGRSHAVAARREILLCAGAIDSPRLLLLSGVGPAADLERLGIGVTRELSGVGANLQDHLLVAGVLYEARGSVPPSQFNHSESLALTHGLDSAAYADVLVMGLSVPFVLPGLAEVPQSAFSIVPAYMNPHSRGRVTLRSADPDAMAAIDPGFLTEPADLRNLVHAVELARDTGARKELRDWVKREVYPGPAVGTREALVAMVRAAASSFYHPIGTCRLGADADRSAVVDTQLRVRGIAGLRVVDASVFPSIPQAMTEAATLAVAERAAALLRG